MKTATRISVARQSDGVRMSSEENWLYRLSEPFAGYDFVLVGVYDFILYGSGTYITASNRLGHLLSVGAQPVDVELNRRADLALSFLDCRPRRDAPRKIGHIRRVIPVRLFDHDSVTHQRSPFSPACYVHSAFDYTPPGASSGGRHA